MSGGLCARQHGRSVTAVGVSMHGACMSGCSTMTMYRMIYGRVSYAARVCAYAGMTAYVGWCR